MNSSTLILEDKDAKDTSVTASEGLPGSARWQRPIYRGPGCGGDIFTAAVVFLGHGFAIVELTSPSVTIFPQHPPAVPLDAWVETDIRFPPKKTRPLIGKLARKGRAKFQTAFAGEFLEL